MKYLKVYIILMIILLLSACNDNDSNSKEEYLNSYVNQVTNIENIIEIEKEVVQDEIGNDRQNELINDFIILLNDYLYEENLNGFKNFIDEYGLYSISYFNDGREENKAILVYKEDVREDLFLLSSQSGKAGISLSSGTFSDAVKKVYINDYIVQENALKNVDWLIKDEYVIQNQLLDILKGCQELILENNKYIPQIFRLSDTTYAFSFSDINENAFEKFYGYWVIFDETNDSYVIRAIIELQ